VYELLRFHSADSRVDSVRHFGLRLAPDESVLTEHLPAQGKVDGRLWGSPNGSRGGQPRTAPDGDLTHTDPPARNLPPTMRTVASQTLEVAL
jgi:hypothetical protein